MDRRTIDILLKVLRKPSYYTYGELSRELNKTERTIRNDILKINEFLEEYKMEKIIADSENKLFTDSSEEKVTRIIYSFSIFDYVLQREEKIKIISLLIVSSDSYITINEIADFMNVSRSTVIAVLDGVSDFLSKENILLDTLSGKGIYCVSDEYQRRKLYANLIYEDFYLIKIFLNQNKILKFNESLIINKEVSAKIYNLISISESKTSEYLTEKSFDRLYTYLLISLSRMKKEIYIESKTNVKIGSDFVDSIYNMMITFFNLEYSVYEKSMLMYFIRRLKFARRVATNSNIVKIQALTRRFIENVSDEINIDFNSDYELFESLSNHLDSIFVNTTADLNEDLQLKEVTVKYSEIYEVVKSNIYIFEDFIERRLCENEVIYIMIYLCASYEKMKERRPMINVILICSNGIGSSQLLSSRLKKYFNINILNILSKREAREYDYSGIELIITTVDLEFKDIKAVKVSPYISDSDYLRISKIIDEISSDKNSILGNRKSYEIESDLIIRDIRKITDSHYELGDKIETLVREYFEDKRKNTEMDLSDFLAARFIELDVQCNNWEDAIRKSGEILHRHGYVKERYINSMIHNVKEHGPYIVLAKGLAVPHASIDSGAIKTGFSLIRLSRPVYFSKSELEPVEFVCCLSSIDNKKHLKAFFNLINMFSDVTFKEKIRNSNSNEEVANIIEIYEKKLVRG